MRIVQIRRLLPQARVPETRHSTKSFAAYLEDLYQRSPTSATYLGIHKYNDRLEDYSRGAVDDAIASGRQFRARVAAIDANVAVGRKQLDHEQLLRAIDSRLLSLEVVRPWATDPTCTAAASRGPPTS